MQLPCGRCIGCRSTKAAQWGQRAAHEATCWEHNAFVSLTYDDEHLNKENHLVPDHLTRFFKRLRKAAATHSEIATQKSASIRYLACGEYGETSQRPHYHAVLFNCAFRDAYRVAEGLQESATLCQLWPYGGHRIGEATTAAATYVGQYALKKQGAGDHDKNGVYRPAPFLRMSLRPAIGLEWLKRYATDLQHGYLVDRKGNKTGVPRYYRKKIAELDSNQFESMEAFQYARQTTTPAENRSTARLRDAEIIHHIEASRAAMGRKL